MCTIDSCLVCQCKDISEIQKQLIDNFSNICGWFVDNKLSVHFGEDKLKSILFASKLKREIPKYLKTKIIGIYKLNSIGKFIFIMTMTLVPNASIYCL